MPDEDGTNEARVGELEAQLSSLVADGDLYGLWRTYKDVHTDPSGALTTAQTDHLDRAFQDAALQISGRSSVEALLPDLRVIDAVQEQPAPELLQAGTGMFRTFSADAAPVITPKPAQLAPATMPATTPLASPQPPRSWPRGAVLAAAGVLVTLLIAAIVVFASGGSDESSDKVATPLAVVAQAQATATTMPAALIPTGDIEGTFEHVVTAISGDCSALRLPSGPVAVGTALPSSTARWGIGAADASGMRPIRNSSALAGTLNPNTLTFTVATPDNASSGSGTFARDGTSFTGKSVFKFGTTCTLETSSTARFIGPLFSFGTSPGAAQAVAPTTAPAATSTPQPTTAPVATVPPTAAAPDVPALIRVAVEGEYTQANRAGNGSYLVMHLDARATAFYGAAACQDFFSRLAPDPTFTVKVNAMTGSAPWTWQIYGETVGTIPDAYTVDVSLTQRGQTSNAFVHFAWNSATQQLRVFSPCRPPPS